MNSRDLCLISTGPAKSNSLPRSVRGPAHAELGSIVNGAPDFRKPVL